MQMRWNTVLSVWCVCSIEASYDSITATPMIFSSLTWWIVNVWFLGLSTNVTVFCCSCCVSVVSKNGRCARRRNGRKRLYSAVWWQRYDGTDTTTTSWKFQDTLWERKNLQVHCWNYRHWKGEIFVTFYMTLCTYEHLCIVQMLGVVMFKWLVRSESLPTIPRKKNHVRWHQ